MGIEWDYKRIEQLVRYTCQKFSIPGYSTDDLVQECLMLIWKYWDSYDPERMGVTSFVRMAARHYCIGLLEKSQRDLPPAMGRPRRHTDGDGDDAPESLVPSRELDPAKQAISNETVARWLSALPPLQRKCVVAVFIHDMTPVDAAEHLGLTPKQVHNALDRAKRTLKRVFSLEMKPNQKGKEYRGAATKDRNARMRAGWYQVAKHRWKSGRRKDGPER